MAGKKTNRFYGNKSICADTVDGYYCCMAFDPVGTGERIVRFRRRLGLSREGLVSALAETGYLRVSVTTMGRWERGEVKKMEVEQLEALRRFFRCSHDELVVYRIREVGDERDQLAPFIMAYCSTKDEHPLKDGCLSFLLRNGKRGEWRGGEKLRKYPSACLKKSEIVNHRLIEKTGPI